MGNTSKAEWREVEAAITALEDDAGAIKPNLVVEAARDPDSPLHGYFEWDDSVAAHQHRLAQAGELIRKLTITVTVEDRPARAVRYVSLQAEPGVSEYKSVQMVAVDALLPLELKRILGNVRRTLNIVRARGGEAASLCEAPLLRWSRECADLLGELEKEESAPPAVTVRAKRIGKLKSAAA